MIYLAAYFVVGLIVLIICAILAYESVINENDSLALTGRCVLVFLLWPVILLVILVVIVSTLTYLAKEKSRK